MITLASGQSRPVAVSVDATSAYWVNQGSWDDQAKEWRRDGTLSKVSRNGGGQLILASAQDVPVDVAGDSTSVYWLNSNSGSSGVLKLTPK